MIERILSHQSWRPPIGEMLAPFRRAESRRPLNSLSSLAGRVPEFNGVLSTLQRMLDPEDPTFQTAPSYVKRLSQEFQRRGLTRPFHTLTEIQMLERTPIADQAIGESFQDLVGYVDSLDGRGLKALTLNEGRLVARLLVEFQAFFENRFQEQTDLNPHVVKAIGQLIQRGRVQFPLLNRDIYYPIPEIPDTEVKS